MLKLGEQNISGLYLGGEKIEKAYLGETLVFSAGKPSRLPDGYTELEYISNPNLGYAIGIPNVKIPWYGTRYEFDVEFEETPEKFGYLWGKFYSYTYSKYKRCDMANLSHVSGEKKIRCLCAYSSSSANAENHDISYTENRLKIVVDSPKKIFSVNGTKETIPTIPNSYWLSDPPELFATKYFMYGSDINGYLPLNYKFYSLKISQSTGDTTGDIIYEYVPCIDPNGDVGAYELINEVFVKSADDTKPFTAGPAV